MKNSVVFWVNIDNEESYHALAAFIYKRENHKDLTGEDLYNVTYKYYLQNTIQTNREWVKKTTSDREAFKQVKNPENIKNITEKYEVIYYLNVLPEADFVNLYNLYLLRYYYKELCIIAVFDDYSENKYYEISQFLYHVNCADQKFYKSCYFVGQNVKLAQLHNIQFSRKFIPLQIVNKDSIKSLFLSTDNFLSETYIEEILTQENVGDIPKTGNDLLEGAVKLLHDVRKKLTGISGRRIVQIIMKTDVFSFILLCYVLCIDRKWFRFEMLEKYVYDMQQYSAAIRQLTENIVFHSETGVGTIAFRVHDSDSTYMDEKYHLGKRIKGYGFLEIIVSDFCGGSGTQNIAENFVYKLKDPLLGKKFAGLRPTSFFMHGDKKEHSAWEQFYRNPDNIGKHFGLRIFQSVVTSFDGFFCAESHSGYINIEGDCYFSYGGRGCEKCMPGTKYHIVFPLKQNQDAVKKQDLSLDSGIGISANIRTILQYSTGKMFVNCNGQELRSQEEKNQKIWEMSLELQKEMNKGHDILYASMDEAGEGAGELLAKALVMAMFRIKRNVRIVLYQCSAGMKRCIFDTLKVFFDSTDMAGMFYGVKCQLILYSDEYEETVVDLGSAANTDNINAYISYMKCIGSDDWKLAHDNSSVDLNKGAEHYIPCDVLQKVVVNRKEQTLFEHYTETILQRNIQEQDFGCKFEHTHMRLGSTIHIENFYEAEILFGNKLFVSRFALLLFKDMRESIESVKKLTLYGYGTYSETVLVQMRDMILSYYNGDRDVDYIILEREEERRGFLHKDRIRYNRSFSSDEERVSYFRDRKLLIVVLINSTLKTHARLISMFRDENKNTAVDDKEWLIRNYAVILVGKKQGNQYWRLEDDKKNEINLVKKGIEPTPRYFIQLEVDYEEPLECRYCFPPNPLAEMPLIEVNAASTIPNQAYGIVKYANEKRSGIDKNWIYLTGEKLECLNDQTEREQGNPHYNFTYGHVHRNENHFLYYFKTENIWVSKKEKIESTLLAWKDQHYKEEGLQYNILVAPMHYSNAGFVELVNNKIFQGNAILLRVDFDKEYRCNAYTKFSYLRNYVEQLSSMRRPSVLGVHFVDDSIISGRTFHRAKSLMESILKSERIIETSLEIRIFDKVFVLIDRNSESSQRQYVKEPEQDFYSFLRIDISSLRNHGDSCVLCNLEKEADLLGETASTASVAAYWEGQAEKFRARSLEEYDKKKKEEYDKEKREGRGDQKQREDEAKAYRRLFCTEMAQRVLSEEYHRNDKAMATFLILNLLNTDYITRESEGYEYFLSYLKCISRPFLVFKKPIKEAVFDILLILIDTVVRKRRIREIIKEIEKEKPYLKEKTLISEFNRLYNNILKDSARTESDMQNLVKLLMKQLTELKSNYIIRPEKMNAIVTFMNGLDQNKFELYYVTLICRLVGASSDTNKSVWLDERLVDCEISDQFKTRISLENTRTLRDGIEKFYIKWNVSEEFRGLIEQRLADLRNLVDVQIAERMFDDFSAKNNKNSENDEIWKDIDSEGKTALGIEIKGFLHRLPALEEVDFYDHALGIRRAGKDWEFTLESVKEQLDRTKYSRVRQLSESLKKEKEPEESRGLREVINGELNIYQFNNFRKILEAEKYMDGDSISQSGIDMIICCIRILELCRSLDWPILSKVQELVTLFKVILGAEKVHFIVENKAENTLDEWKEMIEKRFNEIGEKWIKQDETLALRIRTGKHYEIIREERGMTARDEELSVEIETILDRMGQQGDEYYNYEIDRETGIVVWRLTNKERCIWVSMESIAWRNTDSFDFKVEHDLRKVMMFYQELKKEIFNPENDDYMNEISNAQKKLSIYNSNRVYTHTKDFLLREQYEQICRHYTNTTDNADSAENYPGYILKLISDITVSKYYRKGLGKMQTDIEMQTLARWSDLSELLKDGKNFFVSMDGNEKLFVELKISEIDGREEILCRGDDGDAVRDLTLLIYALIMNAAEKHRGKRGKNNALRPGEKRVIVELNKNEHYLVIENECEEDVDIEQIKHKLNHVPESEGDGITLWSMNCYIKHCINYLIMARLRRDESVILGNEAEGKQQLVQLKNWIEDLTGERFTIQPDGYQKDGKNYFAVKVPLFMSGCHCGDAEKEGGE